MTRSTFALPAVALLLLASTVSAQQLDARWLAPTWNRGFSLLSAGRDGRVSLHAQSKLRRIAGMMQAAPGMFTVRLHPSQVPSFVASHPKVRLYWTPPLRPRLDKAQVLTGAKAYRQSSGMSGQGVAVGIIDTGLDPRHPDLRNADGTTRIAWLLDMSRGPSGKHPQLEAMYGCTDPSKGGCRVWGTEDINEALAPLSAVLLPTDPLGHGTHVASIAAGNGLGSKDAVFSGMAPKATLLGAIVARAGTQAVADEDALLAARFIFEQADRMHVPVVVNASLGRDFGPHDGSTWLERGMAEFVGPKQMSHGLVVAAGNSGTLYVDGTNRYGIHTQLRVIAGGTFRATSEAVGATKDKVRGELFVWVSWQPGDTLSVGLDGPGDVAIEPVSRGHMDDVEKTGVGDGASMKAVVINADQTPDDPLTDGSPGALIYVQGTWDRGDDISVTLEGDGTADLWLQGTGDAAPSAAGLGQLFVNGMKQNTVNIPGNHPRIIAVGATLGRTSWTDAAGEIIELTRIGSMKPPVADSLLYFSGAGPTSSGWVKPDLCAPGGLVAGAVSLGAQPKSNPMSMFAAPAGLCPGSSNCMMVDDQHGLASGTSMASPMVAGSAALLLQREPTLTQPELRALLRSGARAPAGHVPYSSQVGAGTLDVQAAADVLVEQRRPAHRRPDPGTSWVTVSSAYALPNPAWPVCGLLKTRDASGRLADELDTKKLSLGVTHGTIVRPLTRSAPGLWDFCVAAMAHTGGQSMSIEVRHDGRLMGRRIVLPIGADAQLATTMPRGDGGCSVGVGAGGGDRGHGWLAVLGAALLAGWKRARAICDRKS